MRFDKTLLFLLIFAGQLNVTHAQEVKKIRIVDSATKDKVPFASVSIKAKSIFFDADSLGQIEFPHLLSPDDTTLVSCVGYYDKYLIGLKGWNSEILLIPKPKVLAQVYIGDYPKKQVGILESSVAFSKTPNLPDRTEYATLIRVPDEIVKYSIDRLHFKIRTDRKKSNSFNPVRINLYRVSKNGEPGEQFLLSDITLTSFTITKDYLTIELSDQNLVMTERAFFVGLQWIKQQGEVINYMQPQISFTVKGKEQLTWRRDYQNNNYKWFLPSTLSFWGNMMIKVDLNVYENHN
jgi:hypothetical protein